MFRLWHAAQKGNCVIPRVEVGLAWKLICDGLYQPLFRLFMYLPVFQEEVNQVSAGVWYHQKIVCDSFPG